MKTMLRLLCILLCLAAPLIILGGKLGDMLAVINVLAHALSHLSVMVIIMKNLKTLIN